MVVSPALRAARRGRCAGTRGAGAEPGAGAAGRGRGQSPEQQAAAAAQTQLEQTAPKIPFDAVSLPLMPKVTPSARPKASRSIPRNISSSTRAAATQARRAARRRRSSSNSTERQIREGVGTERLRLLLRPRRQIRQERQRLGGRRRLQHGDEVQPARPGHDGARTQGRSHRLPGTLPGRSATTPSAAQRRSPAQAPAAAAHSPARPMSPGTRRATSSWRTATTTRASRNSPRTATS